MVSINSALAVDTQGQVAATPRSDAVQRRRRSGGLRARASRSKGAGASSPCPRLPQRESITDRCVLPARPVRHHIPLRRGLRCNGVRNRGAERKNSQAAVRSPDEIAHPDFRSNCGGECNNLKGVDSDQSRQLEPDQFRVKYNRFPQGMRNFPFHALHGNAQQACTRLKIIRRNHSTVFCKSLQIPLTPSNFPITATGFQCTNRENLIWLT